MSTRQLLAALLTVGISASAVAAPDYTLDLRKIKQPQLKYLNLGNGTSPDGTQIRVNNLYMEEGGRPVLPVMGEFHYSRMDERYWRDALLKMKAQGIDIVATYCMWSLHEEIEGEMSWKGRLDLRQFIELCKELGMKVHLRVGPYCNAEIRGGALPDWIRNNKNLRTRSNDPLYLAYVRRWYNEVFNQIKGLQWKDGGPIMAVQVENEYVTSPEMIVAHLTTLKRMLQEEGFDVPIYSMTHWMDSAYPKGEIIPYAGFYIETPWTWNGKTDTPPSNFEYFSYNRLSDNIGNDIIKKMGDVQTLTSELNDSPFFTCEIGVGSTTFYGRRAVVPEEMAGEMINLRLGCGANLMGYYMYVGGSNPIGKVTTLQSSGPRVGYDYQAPIREYCTDGAVMPETKKYNYFMQDFGSELAPAVSYLPNSNDNRDNLQWAVRLNGDSGYLFCSNYIYRHDRKDYDKVRFTLRLKDETLSIPRNKVTIKNGAYFLWPFNQTLDGVKIKYATAQPVCSLSEPSGMSYFFFEDDGIPAEFLIDAAGIGDVTAHNADVRKEKNAYFVSGLKAGEECVITVTGTDGSRTRFVTLTEKQSDELWKGEDKKGEFVTLSTSSLITDNGSIIAIDDKPVATVSLYDNGKFVEQTVSCPAVELTAAFNPVAPLAKSDFITPASGKTVKRTFALNSLSDVEKAFLRVVAPAASPITINGNAIECVPMGEYGFADVSEVIAGGDNEIVAAIGENSSCGMEIEVLLKNGERLLWVTDPTWTDASNKPVKKASGTRPSEYAFDEHLGVYEIFAPGVDAADGETRMYLSIKGDIANTYIDGQLFNDTFCDGTPWILSLSRMPRSLNRKPLVLRVDGLRSADSPIFFESNVDKAELVTPTLAGVDIRRDHRFTIDR